MPPKLKPVVPPSIPEPVPRKPPRPITNALSLRERDIPPISFDEIRKVCKFYQDKGSGEYGPKSKSGRYLFDVTEEVIKMLDALEAQKSIETKVQKQKLEESEKSLHDWSTVFEKKPPSGIKKTILQSEDRIKQLEEELRIEKINHSAAESSMLKIVQQHHESSRNTLEQTVKHLNEKIEDLNRTWKEKYEELEIKYKNRLKKKEKHIDSPKVQN